MLALIFLFFAFSSFATGERVRSPVDVDRISALGAECLIPRCLPRWRVETTMRSQRLSAPACKLSMVRSVCSSVRNAMLNGRTVLIHHVPLSRLSRLLLVVKCHRRSIWTSGKANEMAPLCYHWRCFQTTRRRQLDRQSGRSQRL